MKENEISIDFKTTVINAINKQLDLYPKSTIRDIYKSFFQDEFGPGHLLKDPAEAKIYFEQELEIMHSQGRTDIEPCGTGHKFCRVPMDLIKDGYINKNDYFTTFLSGASEFEAPYIENWKKKWNIILAILKPFDRRIIDFEKDTSAIHEALKSGHYVMHHSSRYHNSYNPHYRIFSVHCMRSLIHSMG